MSFLANVGSLLSRAIPIPLAYKGLSKINPKISNFLAGALAAGYTADQAIDFMRSKFSSGGEDAENRLEREGRRPEEKASLARLKRSRLPGKAATALLDLGAAAAGGFGALKAAPAIAGALGSIGAKGKELSLNQPGFEEFIRQNPAIGRFMDLRMSRGASPLEAARMAKNHSRFAGKIKRIEQEMGQDFVSLIEQLMGMSQNQSAPPEQQMAFPEQQEGRENLKQTFMDEVARYLQKYGR